MSDNNFNLEGKYEKKFVPTSQDLEEEGSFNMCEKSLDIFSNKPISNSENFDSFISKSVESNLFNSTFSIKSTADFFADNVAFYNPLRSLATKFSSNYDSIEVPGFKSLVANWGNESDGEDRVKFSKDVVRIQSYPLFSKVEVPRSFLFKTGNVAGYIKSALANAVSKLERKAFLLGDKTKNQPEGILNDENVKGLTLDWDGKDSAIADKLLDLVYSLDFEYKSDAAFIISSSMLNKILKIKNNQGDYIFENGKLFGSDVHVMNEADDTILFGNFKYAYAICDMYGSDLKAFEMYEKPNMIGFSIPAHCGAAVIEPNAVVKLVVNDKNKPVEKPQQEGSKS